MSAYQPVLDPACGGRMFWFDKSDDRVLFGDVRDESWELCDGRRFDVKPDMLMDYRDLPFPDGTFRMVVLDPPHLRNAGETSYMAQKYGCLDQETWKADLKTMFSECFRVLKEHGVLIFKWNETQIPVSQILKLTAHKPLFGNKQPNRTGTHWIVFMKELCDEIVWQKMVPERVNAILTPDSTGSKLILGHVQSYNDMSYRRRPASEILWAMVKANGKRTN